MSDLKPALDLKQWVFTGNRGTQETPFHSQVKGIKRKATKALTQSQCPSKWGIVSKTETIRSTKVLLGQEAPKVLGERGDFYSASVPKQLKYYGKFGTREQYFASRSGSPEKTMATNLNSISIFFTSSYRIVSIKGQPTSSYYATHKKHLHSA